MTRPRREKSGFFSKIYQANSGLPISFKGNRREQKGRRSVKRNRQFLLSQLDLNAHFPCRLIPNLSGYRDTAFVKAGATVNVEDSPLLWLNHYLDTYKGDTFIVEQGGGGCVFAGDEGSYAEVLEINAPGEELTTNFNSTLLGKFPNLVTINLEDNKIKEIDLSGLSANQFRLSQNRLNPLDNYTLFSQLSENGTTNGYLEITNYGKLQGANALQFVAGTVVNFPDYVINGNFTALLIVEITNGNNQILLKGDGANFGLYKRGGSDNRIAINFNGVELVANTTPTGWTAIEWSYNNTTKANTLKVNNSTVSWSGTNINNLQGNSITQISDATFFPFLGKVAELSISNFLNLGFSEETGRRVYDKLNNNDANIIGSFSWVIVEDAKVLNYPHLEGYSAMRNSFIQSANFSNAVWLKNQGVAISATNILSAPTTGSYYSIRQSVGNAVAGAFYTLTVRAKSLTTNWLNTSITDFSTAAIEVWFNIATGEKGGFNKVGNRINLVYYQIVPQNDGYFDCIVSVVLVNTLTSVFGTIGVVNGNNSPNVTAGASIQLMAAQLQTGASATPYQPTLSTNNVGAIIPKRIGVNGDIFGNPLEFAAGALPYPDATIIADGTADKNTLLSRGYTIVETETI